MGLGDVYKRQVKGKKNSRHAVSDWMEIEKQRGISVTSSVLQFRYEGKCINILDTPGHQDFSEDTYRTLMAADSAVMVTASSSSGGRPMVSCGEIWPCAKASRSSLARSLIPTVFGTPSTE